MTTRTKDFARVQRLEDEAKVKTKAVAALRRMVLPQQLWCPFCLWEPSF